MGTEGNACLTSRFRITSNAPNSAAAANSASIAGTPLPSPPTLYVIGDMARPEYREQSACAPKS